jgi:hypothetical protein
MNRTSTGSENFARISITWQAQWNRKKGASRGSPKLTDFKRKTEGYSVDTYQEPDRHDPPFSTNLSLSPVKRRKLGLHTIELSTINDEKKSKQKRRRRRENKWKIKLIIGIRAALLLSNLARIEKKPYLLTAKVYHKLVFCKYLFNDPWSKSSFKLHTFFLVQNITVPPLPYSV